MQPTLKLCISISLAAVANASNIVNFKESFLSDIALLLPQFSLRALNFPILYKSAFWLWNNYIKKTSCINSDTI